MALDIASSPWPSNLDSASFRGAMRHVPGAVAVITSRDGDGGNGMTATAVISVTVEPPRLLVCVNKSASVAPIISRSGHFAVNFLASDQLEIARRFSTPKLDPKVRLANLMLDEAPDEALVIAGTTSWFACDVDQAHDCGTHILYIGDVVQARCTGRPPLVYHDGRYTTATTV
jgi:flavin reductase